MVLIHFPADKLKINMEHQTNKKDDQIRLALSHLDKEKIQIEGASMKPSECYHFSTDPLHLLFNTNCPESLKEKISGIVQQYYPDYLPQEIGKTIKETKEYQLVASVWVNGALIERNLDSISGTEKFTESYLQDLVEDFFKEEFPDAKLQIQKITLVPVN